MKIRAYGWVTWMGLGMILAGAGAARAEGPGFSVISRPGGNAAAPLQAPDRAPARAPIPTAPAPGFAQAETAKPEGTPPGETTDSALEDLSAEVVREKDALLQQANQLQLGLGSQTSEEAEKIRQWLASPEAQRYLQILSDPPTLQALQRASAYMLNHPKKMELLYAQIGFVLLMIVFRAWRLSKNNSWLRRMLVRTYCFVLGAAGSIVGVPCFVLGDGYWAIMKELYANLARLYG